MGEVTLAIVDAMVSRRRTSTLATCCEKAVFEKSVRRGVNGTMG